MTTMTAKWRERMRPAALELAELFDECPFYTDEMRRIEARLAWDRLYERYTADIDAERSTWYPNGRPGWLRPASQTMAYRVWRDELARATGTLRGRMLRPDDPVRLQRVLEAAGQQRMFA